MAVSDRLNCYVEDLARSLPGLMRESKVVGLSLALVESGQLAWSGTYGVADVSTQIPVTTNTVFEAASLTKPLFAYSVIRAVQAGIIDLDKPIIEYLPEDRNSDQVLGYVSNTPDLHLVTARHILSHSAGFPNWRKRQNGIAVEPLRARFSPGSRFSYSGEGYVFLQKVMDRLTGDVEEYIGKEVLAPLGMHNSSLHWDAQPGDTKATGHNASAEPRPPRSSKINVAASLHTTPEDYARFLMCMVRPSPETEIMLKPHIQMNYSCSWSDGWPDAPYESCSDLHWGLGWGIERTSHGDCFWQWGDNGMFQSFALGCPAQKTAIVLMSNSESAGGLWRHLIKWPESIDHPCMRWLDRI